MSQETSPSVPNDDRPDDVAAPPYVWLDDPAQPFSPVPVGVCYALGALLAAVGLFGVVLGLTQPGDTRAARLVVGLPIAVLGLVIVQMGRSRRAWRARYPGLDPVQVARAQGGNVGSVWGNDSRTARLGRWLLVVVSAAGSALCVFSAIRAFSGASGSTPTVGLVLLVLALGLAWVGYRAARRAVTGR